MAKQGNYVSISNIDANWAGDLSKTLGNLGSKYADLATEEKKAAERLAEREESKRRYEQGRLDTAARNAVLDARAEQTRQNSMLRWISEQNESKRRWDLEEKRRADAAKLAEKEREALKTYLSNYTREGAAEAALARDPELQAALNEQFDVNRETLARNAIIESTKAQQSGMGNEFGESMGLTESVIPKNAYEAILKARETNPDSPMVKAFDAQLAQMQQDQQNYLANTPVYKEQENARITREMLAAGVKPSLVSSIANDLSGGYNSVKDVNAQALAWQKTLDAKAKANADLAYKALNLSHKNVTANGSTYIKPKSISDLEAKKTIDEKFNANSLFGLDSDNTDFFNMFKAAQEAGVDDAIAMRALEDKVDDSIFGRSEQGSVEDFIKYAQAMEAANTANKTGRSYKEYLEMITPKTTGGYNDPIEANRDAFIAGALDLRPTRQGLPLVPFAGDDTGSVSEKSVPSVDVLTPTEEASIKANAIVRGIDPQVSLDFERNQRAILLDRQANPNKLALETPTAWTSIPTKQGSKKGPKENFQDFIKDSANVDLSRPAQVEALGKLYSTNAGPLPNEVVIKIVNDIRSGNFTNAMVAPYDASNMPEEPGLKPVHPELILVPAARNAKQIYQGIKSAPGYLKSLLTPKAPKMSPANPQTGPTKEMFWKSLETPPTQRLGDDLIRLNRWLRQNANPR